MASTAAVSAARPVYDALASAKGAWAHWRKTTADAHFAAVVLNLFNPLLQPVAYKYKFNDTLAAEDPKQRILL